MNSTAPTGARGTAAWFLSARSVALKLSFTTATAMRSISTFAATTAGMRFVSFFTAALRIGSDTVSEH
jgi:hypothetical protein